MISDNASFGMLFKSDLSEVSLGGNYKFRNAMENILTEYFGIEVPEMLIKQKNKIRFIFPATKKEFNRVIHELESHGYTVNQVTKIGRIMI